MVIFQIQHGQACQVSELVRYLTTYAISWQFAEFETKATSELLKQQMGMGKRRFSAKIERIDEKLSRFSDQLHQELR